MRKQTLTNKQRAFVEEYLRCWNATQAAIAAGYSERTAAQGGYQLLQKNLVRAEIQARLAAKAATADEALARIAERARGSMADFLRVESGFEMLDLENAKRADKLRLVKKIKMGKRGVAALELYDAQRADEFIVKTLMTQEPNHDDDLGDEETGDDEIRAEARLRIEDELARAEPPRGGGGEAAA